MNGQVHYLGTDAELQEQLAKQIAPNRIALSWFQDAAALEEASASVAPDVLVLDVAMLPAEQTLANFVQRLMPATGNPPVLIVITEEQGIEWRLQAIRSGAQAFFTMPVQLDELTAKVIELVDLERGELRILIVEDDHHQAMMFSSMLSSVGMSVTVLSSPLEILDNLRALHPDLILMDLYMPDASGVELTRIIRDHDLYYDVPIVYVSAEHDPDRQLEALRIGGDGFLCKPVGHKVLVGTIKHRVAMHRWFKGRWLARRLRLEESGLIRRRAFMNRVDQLMRAPESPGRPWAVMVIDVDEAQRLLRRLGISGTEHLVQRLGPLIAEHLDHSETTTRVADFRYALLARRRGKDEIEALAERIGAEIRAQVVETDGGSLRVTVSIGIGPFSPPASDAVTLISRGQQAATMAYRAGGNQVAHWVPKTRPDDRGLMPLVDDALLREGFQLYFQPILSVRRRRREFYETLLRLVTPDSELIPPLEFLRVADEHGKGRAVDRWAMTHALDVLESCRNRRKPLRLMVHQKLGTLMASEWLDWFRGQIVERDLIKQRPLLVLQANELVSGINRARSLVQELTRLGVKVCVANFTGAEEHLAMLDKLRIQLVKLPLNRLANAEAGAVERLAVSLHERGVALIAAGVEDADTLALAWRIQPQYVQGNYLKMPSAELGYDLELDIERMP